MMYFKLLYFLLIVILFTGCQFNEEIVLNEDGSGTMNIEINLDALMEITQGMSDEKKETKLDTVIYIKDFLEEKKDSITTLSMEEQQKLKKLELYKIQIQADSEEMMMRYKVIGDFKNVEEMNGITEAVGKIGEIVPTGMGSIQNKPDENSEDLIGVKYSFKNNVFRRISYIKDEKLHKQQIDSMQSIEGFLGTSQYSLQYIFPKKIKRTSNPNVEISSDRKSVNVRALFFDYFKNPELLNLEVELEK